MCFLEGLEFITQQDVPYCAITEDELMLSAILVLQGSLEYLIDRCDASATSNVANLLLHLGHCSGGKIEATKAIVLQLAVRARHSQALAWLKFFEILSHKATFRELGMNILSIDLDHKVDESLVFDS